jgi:hypothetical protein
MVISRVDSTTSDSSPVMKKSVRSSFRLAVFSLESLKHDHRGVDLISDVLPFGRLWYDTPIMQSATQCTAAVHMTL